MAKTKKPGKKSRSRALFSAITGKHTALDGSERVDPDELPPDPHGRPVKKTSDVFPAIYVPEDDPRRPAVVMRWIALAGFAGVVAAIYAIVHMTFLTPSPRIAVKTTQVPATQELVRVYEGSAVLRGPSPTEHHFQSAGKVAHVAATGTAVKKGAVLASLDGIAPLEKEKTSLEHRLTFYQGELEASKKEGYAEYIKRAERKLSEKTAGIAAVDEKIAAQKLFATIDGQVSMVDVAVGAAVEPSTVVLSVTGPERIAQLTFPSDQANSFRVGEEIQVRKEPATYGAAKIVSVKDGVVTFELDAKASAELKRGDAISIVRARHDAVARIPAAAIVRRGGHSTAFVLSAEQVQARVVTVIDRTASEAIVQGLKPNEEIVVESSDLLYDNASVILKR